MAGVFLCTKARGPLSDACCSAKFLFCARDIVLLSVKYRVMVVYWFSCGYVPGSVNRLFIDITK
jgi:hypothetical protein